MQEKSVKTHQYLFGGVLASVTASICCLGPFVLLATGISGAWMSRVMVVEPFQPLLAGITLVLFALAGKKIFFSMDSTGKESNCLTTQLQTQKNKQMQNLKKEQIKAQRKQKIVYCVSGALAMVLLTSEYWIVVLA